jgi:hypothetical protein
MRPDVVVVIVPQSPLLAGIHEAVDGLLIQAFIGCPAADACIAERGAGCR